MILPPMSLQPLLSSAAARSGPIFTQDAWMLGRAAPRARRATACIRKHSCRVGPLRARPDQHIIESFKVLPEHVRIREDLFGGHLNVHKAGLTIRQV